MGIVRRLLVTAAVATGAGFVILAATSSYYGGSDGQGCARCHEIRPMADSWAASTHRSVPCKGCHGSSLTADLRMHLKNVSRVWLHARGEAPEQIHVRHQDVAALVDRCRSCHAQEYSAWRSGPHGVGYARIFLDETHNENQQLMDDCLRCHGMHFEGGIAQLVVPIDRKGPWRLRDAAMIDEPAISCLVCHQVHRVGQPLPPHAMPSPRPSTEEEINRPSLALYDRRSQDHVAIANLPLPTMRAGARVVHASPDRRQALCYQCHAPRAEAQVFSGDDRTPTGVHEGLSCLSCHQGHGQSTRASCNGCHPRLSNCGLDVEKMDTTFRSLDSPHDVHSVACADCHPKGIPRAGRGGSKAGGL
jgi:Cytochrome c3/Cytochrome c554 and c-prime